MQPAPNLPTPLNGIISPAESELISPESKWPDCSGSLESYV
nr:hypothetical protein [Serratia oryzae]